MDGYQNYRQFLDDLTDWGDGVMERRDGFDAKEMFAALMQKATLGVERDVFSPFLYITLAAGLEGEEQRLLAAALYAQLNGKFLTIDAWGLFLSEEERGGFGAELFYQSAPLLYEREAYAEQGLLLVPQVFLFLRGVLLERQELAGMEWYADPETELAFLGTGLRVYEKIRACLSGVAGKKLIYLQGERGSGRKLNYAYLAAQSRMGLAVISYEALQSRQQLREMQTACLLNHALFVIELPDQEEDLSPLFRWLEDEETVFLVGTRPNIRAERSFQRQYLPFSIHPRQALYDRELFERLTVGYPWEREDIRTDFLNRYNFLPGRMRDILELAKAHALSAGSAITADILRNAILGVSSHCLDRYAKKIEGLYGMDDLILPDTPKQKLLHIINRVRNRKLVYETWGFLEKSSYGNGTAMIFAGPPGTGKTMAAQVMAAELGMELYRVELPAIVDKYIGETEKKLNRIFGEAEKSMAILFFDEADVLFSKRTEIKESNDKYSNMEIAFLLQKMEEYEGVSILATNYLQNFDNAFRRRVSDIITFPLPDEAQRRLMWQSMLPSRLPVSDEIDFDFLARQFEISGSMIKNVLIYAGFLAAEEEEPLLTMEQILRGLGHELEKSGKKLSRDEYGEYGHLF